MQELKKYQIKWNKTDKFLNIQKYIYLFIYMSIYSITLILVYLIFKTRYNMYHCKTDTFFVLIRILNDPFVWFNFYILSVLSFTTKYIYMIKYYTAVFLQLFWYHKCQMVNYTFKRFQWIH